MIDMSVYTIALTDKLTSDIGLSATCTIERSTSINFDPARCPWLGVYPGDVDTQPKLIAPRSWQNAAELQIVVQAASLTDDGTTASDELESLISQVLAVVDADLTLGVVGVRVLGIGRQYRYVVFDEDGVGGVFMPQAIIKLKLDVRSQSN